MTQNKNEPINVEEIEEHPEMDTLPYDLEQVSDECPCKLNPEGVEECQLPPAQ